MSLTSAPLLAAEAASSGLDRLRVWLLIGSIVMLVAVAAVRLSTRSGLPSLLLYLGLGLLLGSGPSPLIVFNDVQATQVLGYAALVLILAEGGLTTSWSNIRRSVAPAALLSTVGVVVSVVVVALAATWWLHLPWLVALLVGAIVSSTDAAAVFAVLRNVPLPRRLSGMLEAESGFNDAPVVILVVALATAADTGSADVGWFTLGALAAVELVGGTVVGAALGWVGGQVLKRVAGGSSALFSIGVLALTILAYAAASSLHLSGFIATYLSALVLNNMGLPNRQAFQGFANAMGWVAQIGLFVLLGLLADAHRLTSQIVPALVIGTVLLLVARPLSVVMSTIWFRMSWRDQVFLSWAGLRGAVPVVLATVPLTLQTPNTEWIFDLVFVLVVVFTIVQAPTLPWVARWLGLTDQLQTRGVELEALPLAELGVEVLHVTVGPDSRLNGVAVFELRLPKGSEVTLIVRAGDYLVPEPLTPIRQGDELLVVTTTRHRDQTSARLRAVSRAGRLAGWDPKAPASPLGKPRSATNASNAPIAPTRTPRRFLAALRKKPPPEDVGRG